MAAMQVLIGYSKSQGRRRTTVIPDDDLQVPGMVAWLQGMGEAVLVGTLSDYRLIGPDAILARYLGRAPASDRHAIVNATGIVVAIVLADRELDYRAFSPYRMHRDPANRAVVGKHAMDLGLLQ